MKKFLACILSGAVFFCGCGSAGSRDEAGVYRKITPEEAKAIMDSRDPFILLDVRTQSEFDGGHIEGAVLIPDTEIEDAAQEKLPEKDALILIYCRTGRRSALAANALLGMGYTNVYDFGGIVVWPYGIV